MKRDIISKKTNNLILQKMCIENKNVHIQFEMRVLGLFKALESCSWRWACALRVREGCVADIGGQLS
jgi:hypothetical protein